MYQNSQPLGTSIRGGGGGWRALSFMAGAKKDTTLTPASKSLLETTGGPTTVTGAVNWYDQMMGALGQGNPSGGGLGGPQSGQSPYANTYRGYTAGTGVGNQQSKSSY